MTSQHRLTYAAAVEVRRSCLSASTYLLYLALPSLPVVTDGIRSAGAPNENSLLFVARYSNGANRRYVANEPEVFTRSSQDDRSSTSLLASLEVISSIVFTFSLIRAIATEGTLIEVKTPRGGDLDRAPINLHGD